MARNTESVQTIATSAGSVAYRALGEGPPLMLLHANTHDSRDYDQIIAPLARRFRVLAVDFPGHGASGLAENPTAVGFAAAIESLIEQLELPSVALIGNSIGGYAAARFAIRQPQRCRALVLVQTGGFIEPSFKVSLATRILGNPRLYRRLAPRFTHRYMNPRTPEDLAAVERACKHADTLPGAEVAAGLWRSFRDPEHDLRAAAKAITSPTLVVWGSRDPIRPVGEAQDVLRYIPHAKLACLDTGHVPFVSDPGGFLQIVEPFLERHGGLGAQSEAGVKMVSG